MLKTFRIGGIHPKENKLTSQCPVTAIPVPRQVSLMLNQHIGAPANCIVKKGDTVKVGDSHRRGQRIRIVQHTLPCIGNRLENRQNS